MFNYFDMQIYSDFSAKAWKLFEYSMPINVTIDLCQLHSNAKEFIERANQISGIACEVEFM